MAKSFINLRQKEQIKILDALSLKIGRSALHLEKDLWLCWALQNLFSMPNRLPMAFKGGTSLSKVFGAIHRFSNDINQLKEVIKIKKAFYDASYANYDECLTGKLHLIPNANHLHLLKTDFHKMLEEKMFYGEQPNFDNIIQEMSKLEYKINNTNFLATI